MSDDGLLLVEYFDDFYAWPIARECCMERGGDLIVISNADENKLAQSMQDTTQEWNHAWIGLRNDGAGFRWADGTMPTYVNWGEGYPEKGAAGEAVILRWTSGTWVTVNQTEERRFLCSIPQTAAPTTTGTTLSPITAAPTPSPELVSIESDEINASTGEFLP